MQPDSPQTPNHKPRALPASKNSPLREKQFAEEEQGRGGASGPGIVPNHMQAEMAPPDLRTLDQQPGVGGPRHGARRRERRSPRLCGQGRGQGGNMYLARWGYVCMFTHNPRMPCRERGMGSERALAMNENRGFEPRQTQFGSSLHRFPGTRL